MLKSKKKLSGRILSLFFSLLLVVLSVTVAFAAEPIALTESNVVSWPTTSGEIFYGQKLSDGIYLNNENILVTTDGTETGTVVAGKFEFIDPNFAPTTSNTKSRANIKFVPDDTTLYTGFEVTSSRNVTYVVNKTSPVFVDEVNDPLVASKVEEGAALSTSILSGGQCMNPYNQEESKVLAKTWVWSNGKTIVTESGYYEAKLGAGSGYAVITMQVYVAINGDIVETSVSETPTVPEITYDGVTTWADVTLEGGVAVEKDTTTAVEGTFAITDSWKRKVIEAGSYEIDAVFTPNDTEAYTKAEFKIPVTVNAATVKFVDESGNDIVPEITLDRILEVGNDLTGYLKPYLNASCSFNYEETKDYGEKIRPGTHEYTVKTIIDDPNYERYGTLTFKVTVNKQKVTATVKNVVGGKQIYIEGGDTYHLNGTFKVKYSIGDKEAGIIEGVEFNKPFEFKQNKSGIYTYDIVYEGTADDYYDVTVVAESEEIRLKHNVKVNGGEATVYTYGDMVTVKAPAHEKPYYVFAGWGDSAFSEDGEVSDTITFSMPDEDIELEATYEFSLKAFFEYIFSLIVDFFAKIAEFLQLQKVCDFFAGIFAV